jgi:hypothetical protein
VILSTLVATFSRAIGRRKCVTNVVGAESVGVL